MTALEMAARDACAEFYSPEPDVDIDHLSKEWLPIARAVLMAVRDGSPAVTQAVARAAWHSGSGQNPAVVWTAGVDAILNEGQP